MDQKQFHSKFQTLKSNHILSKFSNINFLVANKKSFTCQKCGKQLSSQSSLNLHIERHKNLVTRKTFSCIVENCKSSFLYICTLKKHFQKDHDEIYEKVLERFPGNERSFLAIYKNIKANPENFNFIKTKKKIKVSYNEFKTNNEISFQISNEFNEKLNNSDKNADYLKTIINHGNNLVNFSQMQLSNCLVHSFNLMQNIQSLVLKFNSK